MLRLSMYIRKIISVKVGIFMKFSDKVRTLRIGAGLTQQQLAASIGVSLRTVTNYETGSRYPKKRELYAKLSEVLKTDINYLLTEDEEFIAQASAKYGDRGARQAQELLAGVSGLFSGGEMEEEDMDEMMLAIQDAYWRAKKKNRKFAPKKHKGDA